MTIAPYVANTVAPYVISAGKDYLQRLYQQYDIDAKRRLNYQQFFDPANHVRHTISYAKTPTPAPVKDNMALYRRSRFTYGQRAKRPYKNASITRTTIRDRLPRKEIKSITNYALINGPSTTGGTPQLMTSIGDGTSASSRNGNQVRLIDFRLWCTFSKNSGTDPYIWHRIIVFGWKQGYTSPTGLSLLQTNTLDGVYNTEEARNYIIYVDKLIKNTSQAGVAAAYAADQWQTSIVKKCPMTLDFTGPSGSVSDQSLWVMVLSTTTNGVATVNSQVRFVDQ